ncbi:hypothetical protein [Bacillus phage Anath]|uniref:Uncharacterized protein n=1 Tax=Bacillus phage Anath TaxID=2108114 RepID=A0A2P1JUL1_9CAUD|nr:hypothetical protein [Bacillus phage Anath]
MSIIEIVLGVFVLSVGLPIVIKDFLGVIK